MKLDAKLGKRQMEVAEFIGFGYSIKETADHLKMSVETVKSTLKVVYAKIGIQKATELSKFVFCRRFDIPLSLCQPMRQIIASVFLVLFVSTLFMHDDFCRGRRIHRIERVIRVRRIND